MRIAAVVGVLIVALHGAGFVWLAQRSGGHELAIDISNVHLDGGPGLVRKRWTETFRGGFTREVGVTQLVGPFQDPAKPACTGRLMIDQQFLTDQVAPVMQKMIDGELRGQNIFPIGDYKKLVGLSLAWAQQESNPGDHHLLGKAGAPNGYVRASARAVFDRVEVPVVVALIPERAGDDMKFRIAAQADLDFDNRVLQWVSDKVGADAIATKIAREQIDDVLVTTFAPPPPFDLGGGQTLQFTFCDAPVEIVDHAYGALPFGVVIHRLDAAPEILPPRFGLSTRTHARPRSTFAIDLDIDALNALLYEVWRTGWLDDRLAEVGLDRRFNNDPTVTEYLDLRISAVRLALPPVIEPGPGDMLRLAADARVAIASGQQTAVGRVYGALDFKLLQGLQPLVTLGGLELSCERTPTVLVPCYGDLVAAIRGRGSEFQGALTDAFSALIADIFVNRHLGAEGLPVDLVIDHADTSLSGRATLHLELGGKLVTSQ